MSQYKPVDLNKHKSEALVVHCADPRFQKAYRDVIDHLEKHYDLVVVPGASKSIVDNGTIIDNIKMLHSLHHFEEIHIMDHVECGAFGKIDDEVTDHSAYLKKAENKIKEAMPDIKVVSHLLGAERKLELKI